MANEPAQGTKIDIPPEHKAVVTYLLDKLRRQEQAFKDAQQEYQQYIAMVAAKLKLSNVQYLSDEMVFVDPPKPGKDGKVPV